MYQFEDEVTTVDSVVQGGYGNVLVMQAVDDIWKGDGGDSLEGVLL